MNAEKNMDKEALKKLREERRVWVENAKNTIKAQNQIIKQIKEQMQPQGRTVPEIASALEIPTSQAFWYVMALKKYGIVAEGPKEGEYYQYLLAGK